MKYSNKNGYFLSALLASLMMSFVAIEARTHESEKARAERRAKSRFTGCPQKTIDQCIVDRAGGSLSLTQSGEYCFASDIVGEIIIAHDEICIDLKSHRLNGNGAASAFSASGRKNICIKNGSIINNGNIGISCTECQDITVEDVNISPVEQALVFVDCRTGDLTNITANNNFNTRGGIINLLGVDNFNLIDVESSFNIVDRAQPFTDSSNFLFFVFGSSNTLINCRACNNELRDGIPGFLINLAVAFGSNNILKNCLANDNFASSEDPGVALRHFFGIDVAAGSNFILEDCQGNNTAATISEFTAGIESLLTSNLIMKSSQGNGTSIAELIAPEGTGAFDLGPVGLSINACTNYHLINCQGSETSVDAVVERGPEVLFTGPTGILLAYGNGIVEKCQANNTSLGSAGPNNVSVGIFRLGDQDSVIIRDSQANNTTGGQQAYGILVLSEQGDFTNDGVQVLRCSTNHTTAAEVAAGIAIGSRDGTPSSSTTIDSCTSHENSAPLAYGIALENTNASKVIRSEANGNSTAGFFFGPIVSPFFTPGAVFNTNTTIASNSATANGTGFLFAPTATVTNALVQANSALGNTAAGFQQQGAFTGNWLSNSAQGNNPNYNLIQVIQRFNLANGVYTHFSGTDTLTSLANIGG